jgi:hypothetical protein
LTIQFLNSLQQSATELMLFSYILDDDAQVQQQEQQFTPHIASGISGMELLILINAAVLAAMTFWCSMDICCPFKKNVELLCT